MSGINKRKQFEDEFWFIHRMNVSIMLRRQISSRLQQYLSNQFHDRLRNNIDTMLKKAIR